MSDIPLNEAIFFDAITSHPSTGAVTDADSTPTFEVFEESTDIDIGVGGNLTKRTSKTGNYRGSFTISAANGFEVGKFYNVIGSATVNSIPGKGVLARFRVTAAETVAGKSEVGNVTEISTTVWANDPMLVRTGTAQTGTQNSIKLDSGASSIDGTYDPALVVITGGTGIGQARMIHDYNGSSKFATVGRNWRTIPDNTSQFRILASHQPISTNEGLATGGTASTITLNATASSINNTYNGQLIQIRTGTGQDQCRIISSYDGTTKIATVPEPWVTVPTTSTGYQIWPVGRAMVTSTMVGALTANSFAANWLTAAGLATDAVQEIWTSASRTLTDPVTLTPTERNDIAIALLDLADAVETNRTVRKTFRLMLAALAGKLSGAATTTVAIRDTNDSKDRISATVDTHGNRTAVALDDT